MEKGMTCDRYSKGEMETRIEERKNEIKERKDKSRKGWRYK
jgi:hypothetical protein